MPTNPTNNGRQRGILREIARRAMIERGFLTDFSRPALAELDALAGGLPVADSSARDLRSLLWSSIDNDDTKDLDQLSVSESLADGAVTILIAIADVDALVTRGSAIDMHAQQNTTSVYTPAEIFPMLPERLSTNLTSLRENEDRLAVVVEMIVDSSGSLVKAEIYGAVVRNHAKLAYNSVGAWLEGEAPAPHRMQEVAGMEDQIRAQDHVAQQLKRMRYQNGALDLETLEARPIFEGDMVRDLEVQRKNRARELIENFMIAANGITARFLRASNVPSFRRVVRAPKRWDRIVALASDLGEHLPPEPDSDALEKFLVRQKAADSLAFPELSLAVIKLMGAGEYIVEFPGQSPVGHFGLAVKDYTHSTAPNRRFPDLLTQRLLKAAMTEKSSPYTNAELTRLAEHCTEQEDDANKVERLVRKSAAALLLESRRGEEFDAMVTGASPKGTWVRVFRPPVEGRLQEGFQRLDVGDRVRVRLVSTNVERGFIDFVRSDVRRRTRRRRLTIND